MPPELALLARALWVFAFLFDEFSSHGSFYFVLVHGINRRANFFGASCFERQQGHNKAYQGHNRPYHNHYADDRVRLPYENTV